MEDRNGETDTVTEEEVIVSKEEDEQELQVINDWMKTYIQHKQTACYLLTYPFTLYDIHSANL